MRLSTPSREGKRDKGCEIAVIHPSLHDVGPPRGDESGELHETGGDAAGFVETQLDDFDACTP
jgi:hypothetical protein